MSIFLKEEEKVLEARPVVEMLLNQICIVGSRVGIFSFRARDSNVRSWMFRTDKLLMLAKARCLMFREEQFSTRTLTVGLSVL